MGVPQPDYGGRYAARRVVLLAEPQHRHRIDPGLVGAALGLTGESQVAAWLAEGRRVDEMARDTGHTRRAIYWHLQQIYQKHHISRQADLVRLVLSVAGYS